MILTEYGLHFAKEGDHWRCVEHPDLVMLRGDCYQLNDATLAAGFLSLEGVGITYIMRCSKTAAGSTRARKCWIQLTSSPDGANLAFS
jgi:hypothetical protein